MILRFYSPTITIIIEQCTLSLVYNMMVSHIADIFQYAMVVLSFWTDGINARSLITPDFSEPTRRSISVAENKIMCN